jgi:hypothetical protein
LASKILVLLGLNPEVQNKLEKEILALGPDITHEMVKKQMDYMHAVMLETLRYANPGIKM